LLSLAASGIDSLKPTSSKETHESSSSGGVVSISSTDPRKVRLEASTESGDSEQGIHGLDQQGDDEDSWTLFPHAISTSSNDASVRAEPGSRLKTALVDLFNRAAQLAPNFVDSLLANATLTRNDFLKNIAQVQAKFSSEGGIEKMLDRNGGLIKISNFLPTETADRIFKLISRVPEQDWQEAYAAENASANNIDHAFHSARTFASHHAVFALFKRIMPHLLGDFSMGRYTESHFIAAHDDRAYKEVNGDHFSRHIALIYYCSKDWKPEYGGQLLDLQDNKEYVPEFNSVVAFKVPRFHEVKPVLSPTAQRFSIFGWFFKPGISYDLYLGEEAGSAPSDSVDEE
jgi:Rps23 Pro-64 3,4-dihydroxylase Tpa1-like proline 4-hydroxylase